MLETTSPRLTVVVLYSTVARLVECQYHSAAPPARTRAAIMITTIRM
jgi:hypothetical protein